MDEKLVERLRSLALYSGAGALGTMQYGLQEAATALTLAQARIRELETALEPFARWAEALEVEYADHADDVIAGGVNDATVTFGDIRGAAKLAKEASDD